MVGHPSLALPSSVIDAPPRRVVRFGASALGTPSQLLRQELREDGSIVARDGPDQPFPRLRASPHTACGHPHRFTGLPIVRAWLWKVWITSFATLPGYDGGG